MNRKQASAVNSPEDACSGELVLVTGISNNSCYRAANSISDSDKIGLSPLRPIYSSLKRYCIWICDKNSEPTRADLLSEIYDFQLVLEYLQGTLF